MVKLMILCYFLLLLFILQLLLSTRENMCVLEREIRVSERERERKFESERINKNKKNKRVIIIKNTSRGKWENL